MKHYILVKYDDTVTDKSLMAEKIRKLFDSGEDIPGIHSYSIFLNCVARDNRFDLMIEICMDRDALPRWDDSLLHRRWKNEFGGSIQAKTIFDRED